MTAINSRAKSNAMRAQAQPNLTAELLRSLLRYEPDTGNFIRLKKTAPCTHVGEIAGGPDAYGYITIRVLGKTRKAHRLAWLWMTGEWPPIDIDHRDRTPSNNAWDNLRLANDWENQANAKLRSDNTSGFRGVSFNPANDKYSAVISFKGKQNHLGYFPTAEQASVVYQSTAAALRGEFAYCPG